jgi:hypothetical protein
MNTGPFMRDAGIVQIRAFSSISDHLAPITSPARAADRMRNRKASAGMESECLRRA